MKRTVLVVGLALLLSPCVLASGCSPGAERPTTVVQPTIVPAPPPPDAGAASVIRIGATVEDVLVGHGSQKSYELTAQSDGLLLAQVRWDPKQGSLGLAIDTQFAHCSSPPLETLCMAAGVSAGRTYRLRVFDNAPWDYGDLSVRFALTTSLE